MRGHRSAGSAWQRCGVAVALLLMMMAGVARSHGLLPTVVQLVEVSPQRFARSLHSPLPAAEADQGSVDADAPLLLRVPAHCRQSPAELDCRASQPGAPAGLRGQTLSVERNPVVPPEIAQRAELIVVITWQDGQQTSALLRAQPDQDRLQLPSLASAPALPSATVLARYLRLGLHHILDVPQGADHVLFLLALMLLVPSLRTLLWSVSAFTLGHSLTLAAAALDLLRIPAPPVEILIALSIVFVARERLQTLGSAAARGAVVWGRSGSGRSTALAPDAAALSASAMALAFGLLHGLGFASALAEAGLPVGQRALALLSFNLGVELGQLAWVLLWLLPWRLYRRWLGTAGNRWLQAAPAYAIGCVAAALTLSRLWDVFCPLRSYP